MLKVRSSIVAGLATAALGGTAAVVAYAGDDAPPPAPTVTESRPAPATDPAGDDGAKAPAGPSFEPGRAALIPADTELGHKLNPSGDPTVRLCRDADGSIWVVQTTPLEGSDPYPDTPEDLRRRPC